VPRLPILVLPFVADGVFMLLLKLRGIETGDKVKDKSPLIEEGMRGS
jgi:hypothetical protein